MLDHTGGDLFFVVVIRYRAYCGFLTIGSLSPGHIICGIHFPSIGNKHFNTSSKRKEYKVDDRAKKAALFFLACEANPATRFSIPAAMRARGYSDVDVMNRILIQQVRRESQKNKAGNSPRPETVAAAAMLALSNKTNAVGSVLARISPIPEGSSFASGGMAGNLPCRSKSKMNKSKWPYTPRPTLAPPPWLPKRGEERRRTSAQPYR